MKRRYFKSQFSPQQDAGWGLIFRLNDLWHRVELAAPKGKYKDWNFLLDRIYCNLLYRNKIEITTKGNPNGKIKDIKLSDEDTEIYDALNEKIRIAREQMLKSKPSDEEGKESKEHLKAKSDYYKSLMMKDIWLRKFMQELGLYLREVEYDPSKAIYGGIRY